MDRQARLSVTIAAAVACGLLVSTVRLSGSDATGRSGSPVAGPSPRARPAAMWSDCDPAAATPAARVKALQPGEVTEILEAPGLCVEMPVVAGGEYLIAVTNSSDVPGEVTSFRIRGTAPLLAEAPGDTVRTPAAASPAGTVVARPESPAEVPSAAAARTSPAPEDSARDLATAHASLLRDNSRLIKRLGRPRWPLAAMRRNQEIGEERSRLKQGDTVILRFPRLNSECQEFDPVTARVVYAGPKVLVLEDTTAPLAKTMDDSYRALGSEFERTMLPILTQYFADPLAFDASLDGDGRIRMLFSPRVNAVRGLLGFVIACDFYPRLVAPASNRDEVFYARVPRSAGEIVAWRRLNRPTLIHEAKHLASFAARFSANPGNPPLESSWLEEGTAMIAEELYARTFNGTTWKTPAAYAQGLFCDHHPTDAACADRPYGMAYHYSFLYQYEEMPETRTPLGSDATVDPSFYGAAWALLRWTIDQRAADEAAFLRALVRERTLIGTENLARRAGRPYDQLVTQWSLAMAANQVPSAQVFGGVLGFPSWDLRDAFRGLHDADPKAFPLDAPMMIRPIRFGSFDVAVPEIRAGGSAYFLLRGAQSLNQRIMIREGADDGVSDAGSLRTLRFILARVR